MTRLTVAPRSDYTTFMGFPFAPDLDRLDAHFAVIGMPYGDPYTMDELINDQTNAPTAIRRASQRMSHGLDRWDFDIGGTLFDGTDIKVVDVGDVPGDPHNLQRHYQLAEAAVRKILAAGAFPITLGGDHGVPIPVFRALSDHGPITLIHIDAHLDWRDEVNGAREGYSSTIRRASEMQHIEAIYQIGIRGQGSARAEEVEAAQRYGSNIITVYELHRRGLDAILDQIPAGRRYYLSIDADGLDPAVMPAVNAPQPGGVTYADMIGLIKGLCRKGRLLGMDIVEIAPGYDVNDITSITAGHIILNAIGAVVRTGIAEAKRA
jgi:agmatinase